VDVPGVDDTSHGISIMGYTASLQGGMGGDFKSPFLKTSGFQESFSKSS
jgi:hypothetical protein